MSNYLIDARKISTIVLLVVLLISQSTAMTTIASDCQEVGFMPPEVFLTFAKDFAVSLPEKDGGVSDII